MLHYREGSSASLIDTPSPGKRIPSEYDFVQLNDLEVVATLGMGGFGRVELVRGSISNLRIC